MSEDRSEGPPPSSDSAEPQHPRHIEQAGRFVVPLAAASIAAALLAGVNAIVGPLVMSPALGGVVAMQLLAAAVIGATAVLADYRNRIVAEAQDLAEMAKERAERTAEGRKSMFGSDVSAEPEGVAEDALAQYGRTLQPIGLMVMALGVAAIALLALWKSTALTTSTVFFGLGAVNLIAAFLCMAGTRWFAAQDAADLPESAAVGSILRATQWFSMLGALAMIAHALGLYAVDLWVGRLLLVVALALALEQIARAALSFMGQRCEWQDIRAPVGLVVAESLFAGANPVASTLELLEKRFGVTVRSSYVLGYMRRAVPAIVLGMLVVFWLTTSLLCIQPEEVGVLTRFGRLPVHGWYGPGLHLKFPWPIDRVEKVAAERVQTIVIGHESEEELPYMLWSKAHVEEEYKLVLGEGRELVSLDARVYYRIKDPIKYLFDIQNPEHALKALAYRVLMRETVSSNLDRVLSRDRPQFSEQFRAALQRELDVQETGIEVIQVALKGIHPPVDVAQAYQAVVSAQVERVTLETQAEAERAEAMPAAEAAKHTAIRKSEANAATRLADARGEAIQFTSVEAAYSLEPHLYRERVWLETLEDVVAGKKLYLVEGKTSGTQEYWVDLREGNRIP